MTEYFNLAKTVSIDMDGKVIHLHSTHEDGDTYIPTSQVLKYGITEHTNRFLYKYAIILELNNGKIIKLSSYETHSEATNELDRLIGLIYTQKQNTSIKTMMT